MKNRFYYIPETVPTGYYYEEYSKGEWKQFINFESDHEKSKPVDKDKLKKGKIRLWYFCIKDIEEEFFTDNNSGDGIIGFSGSKGFEADFSVVLSLMVTDQYKSIRLEFLNKPVVGRGQRIRLYEYSDVDSSKKDLFNGYIENYDEFITLYYKLLKIR